MCYLLTATITRENTGEVFETFCPPQWEKDQNKNGDHFILLGECGPWAVFDTPALQTFVVPVKLLTADITVLAENSWNIWLHKREALRLRHVLSAKITITLNKMKINKCSSHFPDTSMWNTQCNSVCLMLSDWLGSIGAPAVPGAVSLPHRYSARIQQPAKYTQQSSHSQLDGHHS